MKSTGLLHDVQKVVGHELERINTDRAPLHSPREACAILKEKSEAVQHDYIINKIEERKIAKLNKDYALADDIRNELLKLGVQLIDTKEGTTYKMV